MLDAEHYSELFADAALPKNELLEIHRSKISKHCAKEGYSYPTIRLPHVIQNLSDYLREFIKQFTTERSPFS